MNRLLPYFFISISLHLLLLQIPKQNNQMLLRREVLVFSERASRRASGQVRGTSVPRERARELSANFQLGKFDAALEETIRTSLPIPLYPPLAIQLKQEGIGIVKVKISKEGQVQEIIFKQSTGHSLLDQSITEALKKWKIVDSTKKGSWVEPPPFHFKLKEHSERKRVSAAP